jgi:hypothetical protein
MLDKTDILLKVSLNTVTLTQVHYISNALFVQIFRYHFACYLKAMTDIFLEFCMQLLCFTIQNMILE